MLNIIASDLQYFGLDRVVNGYNQKVSWASAIQLGGRALFYGAGASPDAALASVLTTALEDKDFPNMDKMLTLDPLAGELLQLVVTRSQTEAFSAATWRGKARFRQRRAFWFIGPLKRSGTIQVAGSLPDEVLHGIVQQALGK